MTPTGAVVFDFDGVLADTEGLHLRAFQTVFALRGWQLSETAYFDRYLGFGKDSDLVRTFAADNGIDLTPGEAERIAAAKMRTYAGIVEDGDALFAGAAAAVRRLGARYALAIASGSLRAEIEELLRPSGLIPEFAAIVGADDVAEAKPAPDLYLAAIARLKVPANRAVAIEDSRHGLASARTAGLRTIGLTTSYPAAALKAADVVVATLDEIDVDLIARLLTS